MSLLYRLIAVVLDAGPKVDYAIPYNRLLRRLNERRVKQERAEFRRAWAKEMVKILHFRFKNSWIQELLGRAGYYFGQSMDQSTVALYAADGTGRSIVILEADECLMVMAYDPRSTPQYERVLAKYTPTINQYRDQGHMADRIMSKLWPHLVP